MLSPITPHIAEELWKLMNPNSSILSQKWPEINEEILKDKKIVMAVQINGKLKNTIEIGPKEIANKSLQENKALALDNIKKAILNREPKKIIVIPGRVINIVL